MITQSDTYNSAPAHSSSSKFFLPTRRDSSANRILKTRILIMRCYKMIKKNILYTILILQLYNKHILKLFLPVNEIFRTTINRMIHIHNKGGISAIIRDIHILNIMQ